MWSNFTHNVQHQTNNRRTAPPTPSSPHRRSYSGLVLSGTHSWTSEHRQTPRERSGRGSPSVSSTASSLDSPFGQLSRSSTDRVFPVRSVISLDSTSTPVARVGTNIEDGRAGVVTPSGAGAEPTYASAERSTSSKPSAQLVSDVNNMVSPLNSRRNTESVISSGQISKVPEPTSWQREC